MYWVHLKHSHYVFFLAVVLCSWVVGGLGVIGKLLYFFDRSRGPKPVMFQRNEWLTGWTDSLDSLTHSRFSYRTTETTKKERVRRKLSDHDRELVVATFSSTVLLRRLAKMMMMMMMIHDQSSKRLQARKTTRTKDPIEIYCGCH